MRPTAQEAFWRAWVLREVVVHAMATPPQSVLRESAAHWSQEQRDKLDRTSKARTEERLAQIRKIGIWEHASPKEKEFLLSYGLQMDEYEQLAAAWRMECVAMLMWALGLVAEWPSVEMQTEDPDLLKTLPHPANYKPALREFEEISRKRDLIELWHWRVRTRRLVEEGRPLNPDAEMLKSGPRTYDDIVRDVAKKAREQGDLPEIIDEDFVFRGEPFRDISAGDYSEATSIIMERHYALNWLCGFAPDNKWDETTTDT